MRLPTDRMPVHPGEILSEEFMKPYKMTIEELSKRIATSADQIKHIIKGNQGVNTDIALRLSKLFSTSPELWINGQTAWDLWHILNGQNAAEIENIEPVRNSLPDAV